MERKHAWTTRTSTSLKASANLFSDMSFCRNLRQLIHNFQPGIKRHGMAYTGVTIKLCPFTG